MKITKKQLLDLGPCSEGLEFINQHKSVRAMWQNCKRADWMVWGLSNCGLLEEKLARHFAVICAEHVLHFFEDKYPDDKRPRLAIEAARRCITDNSPEALSALAAARAAWAAVWAAAGAAAGAAVDAAGAAAGAAERAWQADQLRKLINPFKNGK